METATSTRDPKSLRSNEAKRLLVSVEDVLLCPLLSSHGRPMFSTSCILDDLDDLEVLEVLDRVLSRLLLESLRLGAAGRRYPSR